MTRIRLILLAMVAMVFVGAFASASASAHRFVDCLKAKEAGKGQWNNSACSELGGSKEWETKEVTSGEKIKGTSGISNLATEIGSTKVTISCKKDKFEGELKPSGKSKATITYEECSLVGASGCTVANITAKVLDELVLNAGTGAIEDKFTQETTEEPFAKVVIGVCVLKGTYKVTGEQTCELPKGTEFLVLHEIACKTTGSVLKFETKPATYEGTSKVELANADAWAVQ